MNPDRAARSLTISTPTPFPAPPPAPPTTREAGTGDDRRPALSAAATAWRYPPGTLVVGTVWRVVAGLQRGWVDLHGGGAGAVAAHDVGRCGVLRISQALQRGQIVEGVCTGVVSRPDGAQVQVALPDLDVPSVDQQLHTAGVFPGARFHARTRRPFKTDGLIMEVLPGVTGLLNINAPDLARLTHHTRVWVVVDAAHEHPTRPGRASIRLSLAL